MFFQHWSLVGKKEQLFRRTPPVAALENKMRLPFLRHNESIGISQTKMSEKNEDDLQYHILGIYSIDWLIRLVEMRNVSVGN